MIFFNEHHKQKEAAVRLQGRTRTADHKGTRSIPFRERTELVAEQCSEERHQKAADPKQLLQEDHSEHIERAAVAPLLCVHALEAKAEIEFRTTRSEAMGQAEVGSRVLPGRTSGTEPRERLSRRPLENLH